jgi:arginase
MRLTLLQAPYDSGQYAQRMGRGPLHLVERGLVRDLATQGHEADLVPIRLPDGFVTEAGAAAEVQRRIAHEAGRALAAGRFPIVLAGNCSTTLGVMAAHGSIGAIGSTGILWLDAHADFNTPETTTSGFFDGTSLSQVTGGAWQALAASVPGFHPVAERNVILVGARDLDPAEEERLSRSHICRIAAADVPDALDAAFDQLSRRVSQIHLHIDLDVLDPTVGRANVFSVPGGLSLVQAETLIDAAGARFDIASLTLSAYDPEQDPEERIVSAVRSLIDAVLEAKEL